MSHPGGVPVGCADFRRTLRPDRRSFVKAGVLTYFTGIGGLFIKGKDVTVDAGTEYPIYIDGERRITLKPTSAK